MKRTEKVVEKRGPFTVTHRQTIHEDFNLQLVVDEVEGLDGHKVDRIWIDFPQEAVMIFPVDDESNIYLTREYTYATSQFSTEVPGGAIEVGEAPEVAAERELREELGLKSKLLTYLGQTCEITSLVNHSTHLFLAEGVQVVGHARLEPGEIIEKYIVPLEVAYQMIDNGEITSAVVEIGLWRLRRLLSTR